ncbi:MAG: hypothetical protein DME33_12915 [Verrucomicrobia bacterium]|nr:MAG: hypothetical protein DME33_12915 [Verrucomicrobiota bacterium]
MAYQFGDLLLVPLIFSDATESKKRPVLVVHDLVSVVLLVIQITRYAPRAPQDVRLNNWQAAGLRLPSWVGTAKLATVAKASVIRKMGHLSDCDAKQIRETLRRFLSGIV